MELSSARPTTVSSKGMCLSCGVDVTPLDQKEWGGHCFSCYLQIRHPEGTLAADSVEVPRKPRQRKVLKSLTLTIVDPSGTLHGVEDVRLCVVGCQPPNLTPPQFGFQPTAAWIKVRSSMIRAVRLANQPLTEVMLRRLDECTFSVADCVVERTKQLRRACRRGPTIAFVHLAPIDANPSAIVHSAVKNQAVVASAAKPSAAGDTVTPTSWRCGQCATVNETKPLGTFDDFCKDVVSGSSLALLDIKPYTVCGGCSQIRPWVCGQPGCGAMTPCLARKPAGRWGPWMKCLRCLKFKDEYWRCVHCNYGNGPTPTDGSTELCQMCSRKGDLQALYNWLLPPIPVEVSTPVARQRGGAALVAARGDQNPSPRHVRFDIAAAEAKDEEEKLGDIMAAALADTATPPMTPIVAVPPRAPNVAPASSSTDFVAAHRAHFGLYRKLMQLSAAYAAVQASAGDGNGFYRTLLLSFLQHCTRTRQPVLVRRFADKFLAATASVPNGSKAVATLHGLADHLMDAVGFHEGEEERAVVNAINTGDFDTIMTAMMREVATRHILENPTTTVNGMSYATVATSQARTLEAYCEAKVLPAGVEAHDLVLHAAPAALGVALRLVDMDRTQDEDLSHYDYGDGRPQCHVLLMDGQYFALTPAPVAAAAEEGLETKADDLPPVPPSTVDDDASDGASLPLSPFRPHLSSVQALASPLGRARPTAPSTAPSSPSASPLTAEVVEGWEEYRGKRLFVCNVGADVHLTHANGLPYLTDDFDARLDVWEAIVTSHALLSDSVAPAAVSLLHVASGGALANVMGMLTVGGSREDIASLWLLRPVGPGGDEYRMQHTTTGLFLAVIDDKLVALGKKDSMDAGERAHWRLDHAD